jgi:NhaP-type Na+/H+ or K+/H+ antiporter
MNVFLTFSAILATLVLQGLTLGPLIAALGFEGEGGSDRLEELETRLEGARAALDALDQSDGDGVSEDAKKRVREQY